MHTNDEMFPCGSPTFGRNLQDRIESGNGWRARLLRRTDLQGDVASPTRHDRHAGDQRVAATRRGRRRLHLHRPRDDDQFGTAPGKITVTNLPTYNNTQIPYPGNGVIYVKASGSCPLYSALYPSYSSKDPLPKPQPPNVSGCGDASISGTYDSDLTIATQNDLMVTGDVVRDSGGDAMLGLIADGFVRVEHDTDGFALSAPPTIPHATTWPRATAGSTRRS